MLALSAFVLAMAAPVDLPLVHSQTGAELTLRGQYRVTPGWGDEFLASVHLSLPLGRLGWGGASRAPLRAKQAGKAGHEPATERDPADADIDAASADRERPEREAEPSAASEAEPSAASEAQQSAVRPPSKVAKSEHPGGEKPTVTPKLARQTVLRALEHAGFDRARARVHAMVSRARYSALLPDLRLRAARRTDETLRLTPTLDDPYRYTLAGGSDLSFEASLTWRLDRLLFDDPELSAERLLAQRSERMQALARQVLDVLFDWQRARLAERAPGALREEREQAALEELEARTRLFVMTGGWFGTSSAFKAP